MGQLEAHTRVQFQHFCTKLLEVASMEEGAGSLRVKQDETMADETLVEAALRILNTSDPFEKAELGDKVASRWLNGAISSPYHPSADFAVPDRPARLSDVLIRLPPHLFVYILV